MYKRTWISLMLISLVILITSAFGISQFSTKKGSIDQLLKEEVDINQISRIDSSSFYIRYTYNNRKYQLYVDNEIYEILIKEKYEKEN